MQKRRGWVRLHEKGGKVRRSRAQANVHMIIPRRALAAGVRTKISAHSFRATGITVSLENGGTMETPGHRHARPNSAPSG